MRSGRLWGKKEAHCDADDKEQGLGDCWDHDIIDVASRAVIVRVHGPRTAETVQTALLELKERLAPGHVPGLVTTDEHAPYVEALLAVFGKSHTPERTPGPGAPKKPVLVPAPELVYAQVDKQRAATGRVETIEPRLVFGTPAQLQQRLETSPASTQVNTAFIERANGSDRHRNPRKARRVLSFSKQGAEHRAVSWLVMVLGIFCWVPRTLRQTPAMILGKATQALTIREFLHLRPQGFRPPTGNHIRAGRTPFHAPDIPPERLVQWPKKRLIQRSFQHLGVNARGLG
jgi:IS1 family transposase